MLAIQLNNLGKKYRLEYRNRDRLSIKESFLDLCRGNIKQKEFWALKEINLDIPKGQTLGIIGKNGSGKTTLLKILCGVTKPTRGSFKINGKVAGLLELGAGFQGDLTGRENIYLNGFILGLPKKEIQRNINSIIDFADIGNFIDAPVRTYSTGMYLRLGFAITVLLKSDILLIDEVLAVGDEMFQRKCLNEIKEFKKENRTVIFTSHNLNMVRALCERVILMDKGCIVFDGQPEMAINRYMRLAREKEINWQVKKIEINRVYFKNNKEEILNTFRIGEEMKIIIEYISHEKIQNPVFGVGIFQDDIYLIGPNTRDDEYKIDYVENRGILIYKINAIPFREGRYRVSVSIHDIEEKVFYDHHERDYEFFVIRGQRNFKYGLLTVKGEWIMA
jgi:ABC-type polysaccharide/polyol phosphate transport system ATPase subunit